MSHLPLGAHWVAGLTLGVTVALPHPSKGGTETVGVGWSREFHPTLEDRAGASLCSCSHCISLQVQSPMGGSLRLLSWPRPPLCLPAWHPCSGMGMASPHTAGSRGAVRLCTCSERGIFLHLLRCQPECGVLSLTLPPRKGFHILQSGGGGEQAARDRHQGREAGTQSSQVKGGAPVLAPTVHPAVRADRAAGTVCSATQRLGSQASHPFLHGLWASENPEACGGTVAHTPCLHRGPAAHHLPRAAACASLLAPPSQGACCSSPPGSPASARLSLTSPTKERLSQSPSLRCPPPSPALTWPQSTTGLLAQEVALRPSTPQLADPAPCSLCRIREMLFCTSPACRVNLGCRLPPGFSPQ